MYPDLGNPTLRMAELSLGRPFGECRYDSKLCEGTITYALGVVRSTTNPDTHVALPSSATDEFIGVVPNVKEHSTSNYIGGDDFSYKQDQAMPVNVEGGEVVEALSPIVAGEPVYLRFQNGNVGKFENASNADNFLIADAYFDKSVPAATGTSQNYTVIRFRAKGQ